ncbi:DUF3558 domain-containing protein [Actinophytocola xanthii]|uniref:DUF3558 domain-containing protein n=1 Tax=Actinophytocola xanthii TaxID=1912961 RepID=A0A1Q8CQV6_9PSEU|nr:DUF3558 domain-containing protein [Actinophytocola xanthii]OLF16746.1 hypothetical protein BU204_14855 [Actinophytocola xanthii]
MTRRIGILLPLLFITTAGCTSVSAGQPRPGASESPSPDEQTSTSVSAPPARPRDIRLDDVDPCTLLPQADFAGYGLDKPGERSSDDNGASTCAWYGDLGAMDANLVTHEGVEAREGRLLQIGPADPIDGFPAYTGTLPGDDMVCFIAVDVADGQYLDVQVRLYSLPAGVDSVCDYAHQFASSIMSTLVKR